MSRAISRWHNQIPYPLSWALSLFLHGMAIAAALLVMADLTPVPQPEPFRWEVAIAEPPHMKEPPPRRPEPARRLHQADPVPAEQQLIAREPKPVVQTVREAVEWEPMTVTPPVQTVALPTRPIAPVTSAPSVQAAPRPVRTVAQVVTQSASSRVAAVTVAAQPQPVVQVTQALAASSPPEVPAQLASKPAAVQAVPVRAQVATAQSQPVHEPTVLATPTQPVTQAGVVQAVAGEVPAPTPSSLPVHEPAVVATVAQAVTQLTAVQAVPVQAAPPVEQERLAQQPLAQAHSLPVQAQPAPKRDYGWLADLIRNRIEELKHYPTVARLNNWEGKVVLKFVVTADGTVENLEVVESSGYAVLDEAAMETIRRASPLPLTHDLGKPRVTLQFPMRYTLR